MMAPREPASIPRAAGALSWLRTGALSCARPPSSACKAGCDGSGLRTGCGRISSTGAANSVRKASTSATPSAGWTS